MQSNATDLVVNICSILNKYSVRYLLIGGAAVSIYGYQRQSRGPFDILIEKPDIDIWYDPFYPNYFKLLDALEGWGEPMKEFKDETTPDPFHSFFRFDRPDCSFDFLPVIQGLSKFKDSYNSRSIVNAGGSELHVISIDDLIKTKLHQGRPKDLDDIEQLKRMNKFKSED